MTVGEIIEALGLTAVAGLNETESKVGGSDRQVLGGYASDLLSCVMAGATADSVWVTLQAHPNVIAVADLLGLACVIITEGTQPDEQTIERANEKGVAVLLSEETSYSVVSKLSALGIVGTHS